VRPFVSCVRWVVRSLHSLSTSNNPTDVKFHCAQFLLCQIFTGVQYLNTDNIPIHIVVQHQVLALSHHSHDRMLPWVLYRAHLLPHHILLSSICSPPVFLYLWRPIDRYYKFDLGLLFKNNWPQTFLSVSFKPLLSYLPPLLSRKNLSRWSDSLQYVSIFYLSFSPLQLCLFGELNSLFHLCAHS